MDTEPLKLEIDSKQAQADLAALSRALDHASVSVASMQKSFSTSLSATDATLSKSVRQMQQFAQVADLMGKIKLSGDPAAHLRDFANALGALSRAKPVEPAHITNLAALSKTLGTIRVPAGSAKINEFFNALGAAKAPSAAVIARLGDFAKLMNGKAFANFRAPAGAAGLTSFFNALSSAKAPSAAVIARLGDFAKLMGSRAFADFKVPGGAARLTEFFTAISSVKAPTEATVQRLESFLKVLGAYKPSAGAHASGDLKSFFETIGAIKAPSEATIKRIQSMFTTLGEAREIPGAAKIASDLNHIAEAAAKASAALDKLPRGASASARVARPQAVAGVSAGAGEALNIPTSVATNAETARKSVKGLHDEVAKGPMHAANAKKGFDVLGGAVSNLGERFQTGYQLGTVFSALFAQFTFGQFIKGVYDANVELLKLQKGLLFLTGNFAQAEEGTKGLTDLVFDLGLNFKDTAESFSRFSIAAGSVGYNLGQSKEIYSSVGLALGAVGASSDQSRLALYALTEIMQKGTVQSKEFNRQLGAQIPGNIRAGEEALKRINARAKNHYDAQGNLAPTVDDSVDGAQFHKLQQKGLIDAKTFVPEYAKVLGELYEPLRALTLRRPDKLLEQLGTGFVLFKQQVGKGEFLGAISNSLRDLTSTLVQKGADGHEELTPKFKALADTLGHNLATAISAVGNGLKWMADHVDVVVLGIKALLGLKVAAMFLDWQKGAAKFGDELSANVGKALGLRRAVAEPGAAAVASAPAAAATREAAGAAALASPPPPLLVPLSGRTGDIIARRAEQAEGVGASAVARESFFTRARRAGAAAIDNLGRGSVAALPGLSATDAETYRARFKSISEDGAKTLAKESKNAFLAEARNLANPSANYFERGTAARSLDITSPAARAPERSTFGLRERAELPGARTFNPAGLTAIESTAASAVTGAAVGAETAAAAGVFTKAAGAVKAGGSLLSSGLGAVTSGLGKVFTGANKLLAPLPGLGTLMAGAGIALALFGDKLTGFKTAAGNAVTYNDLVQGSLESIGSSIATWWKSITASFSLGGKEGLDFGQTLILVLAGVKTLGGALFGLADALGTVLGGAVRGLFEIISRGGAALGKFAKGDVKGGVDSLKGLEDVSNNLANLITTRVAADFDKLDVTKRQQENVNELTAGAARAADARAKGANTNAQSASEMAAEETALTERMRAFKAEDDASELADLQRRAALSDKGEPTFADISEKLGKIASDAASASASSASAAQTAAGAVTGAVGKGASIAGAASIGRPDAATQAIFQKAADSHGIPVELLDGIAQRESGFRNVKTANGASTAAGIFQVTDGFAKQYGIKDKNDTQQQADGVARSLVANNAFFQRHEGRAATAGELYGAHFLGAGGITSLVDEVKTNPNAVAASTFTKEAAANPGVFYDKAPKGSPKGTRGRARSVSEVLDNINSTFPGGGKVDLTGQPVAPLSADAAEKLNTQFDNFQKSAKTLFSGGDPASAAKEAYSAHLADYDKLVDQYKSLHAAGVPVKLDMEALNKLNARWIQEEQDRVDPMSKNNRLQMDANDITRLRIAGLSDEAGYQEKINALVEEGYNRADVDNAKQKARYLSLQQVNRALESQTELQKTLNDVALAGTSRNGTSFTNDIASQLNSKYGDKKFGADQVAAAKADVDPNTGRSVYDNIVQGAQAKEGERRNASVQNIGDSLSEEAATSRLDSVTGAYRSSFKGFLKDITGAQSDSLDVISSKASAADVALAKSYADLKSKLENPPGFQKWADGLEPFAKKLEDIKSQFVEDLSGGITDALSGDGKLDIGAIVRKGAKAALKSQVDDLLAGTINAFTGKKPSTPATIAADAAAKTSAAAADVSKAATDGLTPAATNLNTSATNLNTSAAALSSAAAAVGAMGASGGAAAPASAVAAVTSAVTGAATSGSTAPALTASGKANPFADLITADQIGAANPIDLLPTDVKAPSLPTDIVNTAASAIPAVTAPGGGFLSGLSGLLNSPLGKIGSLAATTLLTRALGPKDKGTAFSNSSSTIPGVIGDRRDVTITGKQVGEKQSLLGTILPLGLSALTGGFGAGGGGSIAKTFGNIGSSLSKNLGPLGSLFGGLGGVGSSIAGGLGSVGSAVSGGVGSLFSGIGGIGSSLAGGLGSLLGGGASAATGAVSSIAGGLGSFLGPVGGIASSLLGGVGSLFGGGSKSAGAAGGAPGVGALTVNAQSVTVNGAGGGGLGSLLGGAGSDALGGSGGLGSLLGAGASDGLGSLLGGGASGGLGSLLGGAAGGLGSLFGGGSSSGGGILGGLKSLSPIASLFGGGNPLDSLKSLSPIASLFGGGGGLGSLLGGGGGGLGSLLGGGGGGLGSLLGGGGGGGLGSLLGGGGGGLGSLLGGGASGGLGSLTSLLGFFDEGGISGAPAHAHMTTANFVGAPHYAEGTHNTSGGMPAILHPNEAVIPLSRGRSVPVDLGDANVGSTTHNNITSHITVVAPDPGGFRQSQGSIRRQMNRDQKRAALRNLSP